MANKIVRCVEAGRLAYYHAHTDAAFWDAHWQNHLSSTVYSRAAQGELDWFEEPFTRYLPKTGIILEAGCGLGQYVLALRMRGYEVEGVDWGPETVNFVQSLYPDLPVRVGDVTCLDVPAGYYSGYISLGVVEHDGHDEHHAGLDEGDEPGEATSEQLTGTERPAHG